MQQGPVRRRRFSRRVVRQAILGGVVAVVVLALAGGAWYAWRAMQQAAAEKIAEQHQAAAQGVAARLAEDIGRISEQLANLGKDPQIVAAFEAGDDAALAAAAAAHQPEFPFALRLRLLRPGHYRLEQDVKPPLGYASIDLLNRASESDGRPGAEVHLFGTEDQHMVLVRRSRNKAGQTVGLLHLSLDVRLLEQRLSGSQLPPGRVELRQGVGGKSVKLAAAGGLKGEGDPVTVAVPDTRWNILYWPATAATAEEADGGGLPLAAIIGGVVLLLLVGGGVFWWQQRPRVVVAGENEPAVPEGVIYAGAVKAIMEGAHPGMEQLVPNLPNFGLKRPVNPVSQGLQGDDITVIARKPEAPAAAAPAKPKKAPAPSGDAPPTDPPRAEDPTPVPAAAPASAPVAAEADVAEVPEGIFRAYDIRGVVGKTLTAPIVARIGQAIGSEAMSRGLKTIAVGRDGRKSSPELAAALVKGLTSAGCNVVDVGMVPTPVLYFATHTLEGVQGGVMLTGSHNGPEYNGLKIVLGGETLSEEAIRNLHRRIRENDMTSGSGEVSSADVVADYIRRIAEDIPVALGNSFRIVVDCGNGVAGTVAPALLSALGHDVLELYCDVDGNFPNHHPDPSQPENMEALIGNVVETGADLGLAFDGDGDRLGVVDGEGRILWPDGQLMLLAQDVLSRNPGAPIIFDVKCSRHLKRVIEESGGKPVMWRTGHSIIKAKMKETEAPLAGEMSGHIFFKERWYGFDDALYTAARLLEVLVRAKKKPSELFAALPQTVATPELRVPLPEEQHGPFMAALIESGSFDDAEILDIDGIRVEFPDGWGLVRPSNTSPVLVLRFEADSQEALARIQERFRGLLTSIRPDLELPF
jgi:phosphomannomutase/phosphoglucomutase